MEFGKINITNKEQLRRYREQAHRAVQLVAGIPRGILPKDPSDMVGSLAWDRKKKALISTNWSDYHSWLDMSTLTFNISDMNDDSLLSIPLESKSFDEAFTQIIVTLGTLGLETSRINNQYPYEIPDAVFAMGEPFAQTPIEVRTTLAILFDNAYQVLKQQIEKLSNASDIRCWPHHFDIATLITIEENADTEKAKTIGMGMSPGDSEYEEPYFYISPWPYPDKEVLNPLNEPGFWHTDSWLGGVLLASDLNGMQASQQQRAISRFFSQGYEQLRSIL